MTTAHLTRFVEQRPFEPFIIITADGRELQIPHQEYVSLGEFAASVLYMYPTGQVEIVDAAHIVSLRTIHPVDYGDYEPPTNPESE